MNNDDKGENDRVRLNNLDENLKTQTSVESYLL